MDDEDDSSQRNSRITQPQPSINEANVNSIPLTSLAPFNDRKFELPLPLLHPYFKHPMQNQPTGSGLNGAFNQQPFCPIVIVNNGVRYEGQHPESMIKIEEVPQKDQSLEENGASIETEKKEVKLESESNVETIGNTAQSRSTEIKSSHITDDDLEENDTGIPEQKPNESEKCGKCGRVTHIADFESTSDSGLAAGFPKEAPLMSKKKSQKHKNNDFQWICCDNCSKWYHLLCSGLEQYEYYLYDKFHCENCTGKAGPSIELRKIAPHRYRWYLAEEQNNVEIEIGSEKWIENLTEWEHKLPEPNDTEVVRCRDGYEFKRKFDEEGGPLKWTKVFLIDKIDGLDMKMPKKDDFDLEDVVKIIGPDYEVDTIDVYNQNTYSMKLSTFLKKFRDPEPRKRLYNFLSLEFSENRPMREIVSAPKFVREISMVDRLWPEYGSEEHIRVLQMEEYLPDEQRPKVEEFCLAGMANSYTDFHIDFGGSSVYYHIFKGRKVFYIGAPTEKNLKAFQKHECSKQTNEWFGDKVKGSIKRVVIDEGQTLLIPAGWIHAVFTPVDSLVFGGNFLHIGNIEMQIKIYQLETAVRSVVKSDDKFYFPNFEFVHWVYTRNVILERLKEFNDEGSNLSEIEDAIWIASKCLAVEMKIWHDRDRDKEKTEEQQSDYEHKGKLLQSLEVQVKKQEKIQQYFKKPSRLKAKRKSHEFSPADEEYDPIVEKKRKKSIRKDRKREEGAELFENVETSKIDKNNPLKVVVKLEASEDVKNAVDIFNQSRSSSGRRVKVKSQIVNLCGDRLEAKDATDDVQDNKNLMNDFAKCDSELTRCEAIEAGEKNKKNKKSKNSQMKNSNLQKDKTNEKMAADALKANRKANATTAKQRLARKLKL